MYRCLSQETVQRHTIKLVKTLSDAGTSPYFYKATTLKWPKDILYKNISFLKKLNSIQTYVCSSETIHYLSHPRGQCMFFISIRPIYYLHFVIRNKQPRLANFDATCCLKLRSISSSAINPPGQFLLILQRNL